MNARRFAVDALLFDLDGTLVDSIADLHAAAARMLAELGQPPRSEHEVRNFVGRGIANLVARCLGEAAESPTLAPAVAVFRRHYAQVNGERSHCYPGVVQTLETLAGRGLPLACITNKAQDFTLPLLQRLGLAGYFDCVVSGDSLAQRKPAPEPLLHACARIGVTPARALMVGDSANDAQAARAAGCPVLLVDYGYSEGAPVDSLDCDGLLSALPELIARIEC